MQRHTASALLLMLLSLIHTTHSWAQDTSPALSTAQPPRPTHWFYRIFPSLKPTETYNPYTTMKAPFAHEDTPASMFIPFGPKRELQRKLTALQSNLNAQAQAIPLTLPHADLSHISDWALTTVSSALTFSDKADQDLTQALSFFTPAAKAHYIQFLRSTGIFSRIKTHTHSVGTILSEPPLLLNEAASNGRYKWVFQIKTLTTFLPLSNQNYTSATAQNKTSTLQIQITRAPKEENSHDGLLIELWTPIVK